MIFFFKKKPIVLHCVTNRAEVLEFAPIQRANKFLPKWWKDLPNTARQPNKDHDIPTMKYCTGFVDHYNTGVIIPLWCDLSLRIGAIGSGAYRYQYSDKCSEIHQHSSIQYGDGFDTENYQHLKLVSPWMFYCEEEIKFLFVEPTWSLIRFPTLRLLPGLVNYKHQPATNINFMVWRLENDQEILLPFLEPLCHIAPMSDRPLKIVLSGDEDLYKKVALNLYTSKFVNKYRANILAKKQQNEETK